MNQFNQDLHIHSTFSKYDSAVVPEQTVDFIASLKHAKIIGISDHIESFDEDLLMFNNYLEVLRSKNLYAGTEVDGFYSVEFAISVNTDYYIYHCYDTTDDYRGAELLLTRGKPVIIAHPFMVGTNLNKIPPECYIEINNRYVWRYNWRLGYSDYIDKFKFVLSSDAHQPNWLNQTIASFVANELKIKETILFKPNFNI
jgi:hypothetical protein